ncbi:3-oxoadipate enol-lactonase [Arsenicicoccus piscis]|uniref:3-oxoadipate enol-lactonase n=1 Tax=Arsenicicoccus piscis TaxID=673954 RepID=A0ABQ6HSE5_9MICO|nr:3-oxoadipate enol-lactonase [Arsenicicoccus piscis]
MTLTLVGTALTPPSPDKPLLVVGPSLGTAVDVLWERTVPLLAPHFQIVGWDLPGHGRTPFDGAAFTVADLADAVANLVATLRSGADAGPNTGAVADAAAPVFYAGVSLGGATGLQLALDHPGLFTGLAVICSGAALGTPDAWRERAETVRAQGTPVMVEGSAKRWFAPGFIEQQPDISGRLLMTLQRTDRFGYAACCEALAGFDVLDQVHRITDPVVLVNGTDDQVAPPRLADDITERCASARSIALGGVGHLAPAEDPQGTASAVLSLAEHAGAVLTQPEDGSATEHDGGSATGHEGARGTVPAASLGGADMSLTAQQTYDAGIGVRREVLGDAHVDRANAAIDEFSADFQNLITRYAWGTIWTRPGLDRVTRSAITLTALIAHGHWEELAMHVRAALNNGMTRGQIKEVMLQSAIYCSVPSANAAFKVAQRVFAEVDAQGDTAAHPAATATSPIDATTTDATTTDATRKEPS